MVKPLKNSRFAMSLRSSDPQAVKEILYSYTLNTEEVVLRFIEEETAAHGVHIPYVLADGSRSAMLRPEAASIFFIRRDGNAKKFDWHERGHTFLIVADAPSNWFVVSRLLTHFQRQNLSYLQFFVKSTAPLWLEVEISRRGRLGTAYTEYLVFTNAGEVFFNGDRVNPDRDFVSRVQKRTKRTAGKLFIRLVIEWGVPVQRVMDYLSLLPQADAIPVLRLFYPDEKNDEFVHFKALRENQWKNIFGEEEQDDDEKQDGNGDQKKEKEEEGE
ncbi:MAG: hypothetical protein N2234_04075 [Planctomycetota bacterium]|nr:hypothetical protein [Planctomycetota bacterium]